MAGGVRDEAGQVVVTSGVVSALDRAPWRREHDENGEEDDTLHRDRTAHGEGRHVSRSRWLTAFYGGTGIGGRGAKGD
ncbi:hypothetical protein E2562_016331 [Oryza meyeriana var. granulata]|uniref:Uncharacterized protein n=1 Tax=Oryza meyeriana var. granulata TaxID=110450 RepID=A0A6G1DXA0_9ORYZ|nr:hypothetical protein E2562_016331 [Oryza meyeriana var. granulata]